MIRVLGLLLVLAVISCGSQQDNSSDGEDLLSLTIEGSRTATLQVELADEPDELGKGLSGRPSLAPDRGMLFVIDLRGAGFWNKGVAFPLSVAFISRCGVIVDIQDMEAGSEEFHDTDSEFRYGLEVNRGWYAQNGIAVGSRVLLPPSIAPAGGCAS